MYMSTSNWGHSRFIAGEDTWHMLCKAGVKLRRWGVGSMARGVNIEWHGVVKIGV